MPCVLRNLLKLPTAVFLSLLNPAASFGTIILMEFRSDTVIVAADSRVDFTAGQLNNKGKQSLPYTDSACKIVQLDKSNFAFFAGLGGQDDRRTGRAVWKTPEIAKTAYGSSNQPSDEFTPVRVGATWAESINIKLRQNAPVLSTAHPGDTLLWGVFGSSNAGSIQIYVNTIFVIPDSVPGAMPVKIVVGTEKLLANHIPLDTYGDEGAIALAQEFLANQTARSKSSNAEFMRKFRASSRDYEAERLRYAINTAAEWQTDKSIAGGPVDILVLERGHDIRWLYQKDVCK
jgi:hypothetical protein